MKPEEEDAWRKEITLLLAADNVDDETQMDVALQGELADKIVERIFEQVTCAISKLLSISLYVKMWKFIFIGIGY